MLINFNGRSYSVRLWEGDSDPLTGDLLGIDTETELIQNNYEFPDSVLLQVCNDHQVDLVMWQDIPSYLSRFLELNKASTLVFHNAPYDLGILGFRQFYEFVEQGRVIDVGLRYQLNIIKTRGTPDGRVYPRLADVARRVLGYTMDKNEDVRLGFRRDRPLTEDQIKYAAFDPIATREAAVRIGPSPTEAIQVRGMIALYASSMNGMLVDDVQLNEQTKKFTQVLVESERVLSNYGIKMSVSKQLNGADMCREFGNTFGIGGSISPDINMFVALIRLCIERWQDSGRREEMRALLETEDADALKLLKKSRKENLIWLQQRLDISFPLSKGGDPAPSKLQLAHIAYELTSLPSDPGLHIKTAWEENDGWPSTKDEPKQKEVIAGLMKELESVYSIKFPRTKTGEYCLDENVLGMLDDDVSESSFLKPFKEYKHAEKILSTYLNKDCVGGDGRVHPRISYIMLTGRTSYSRPNLQNVPKERGIREMYCAAPGWVLVSIDYDQIELCSLAQACFVKYGKSRMKDIINAGIDVHGWFACILEGKLTREQIEIDPENHAVIQSIIELIKDMKENNKDFKRSRALSKVCDFGQEVLDIAC